MTTPLETLKLNPMQPNLETLDHDVIETITQELNALEKNPVSGWNVTYPTLYNTLCSIIDGLCSKLNCPAPLLFIDFQGTDRHQSSAHLMTDGTAQLHIGVDFIRGFLLNQSAENKHALYRAFKWTIAHELSHLCDPAFKLFGRSYALRRVLDKIASIGLFLGFVTFIPGISIIWGTMNFSILLVPSMLFMIFKKALIIVLHRRFEYHADKRSARVIDSFDPQDMKIALTKMADDVNKSLSNSVVVSVNPLAQLFPWGFKKIMHIQAFLLHPSIKNRITHLQKR